MIRPLVPSMAQPGEQNQVPVHFFFSFFVFLGSEEGVDAVRSGEHHSGDLELLGHVLKRVAYRVSEEDGVDLSLQGVNLLHDNAFQLRRVLVQGELDVLAVREVGVVLGEELDLLLEDVTGNNSKPHGVTMGESRCPFINHGTVPEA